jgi:hypothetical protein
MDTTTVTKEQLSFPINFGECHQGPTPTPLSAKPPTVARDWVEVRMFDPDDYSGMAIAL